MKKIILILLLLAGMGYMAYAAEPDLKFLSKRIINLGDIKADTTVCIKVSFENSGNAPLVVHDVLGSCNCSKTSVSKKLLQPGDQGEIEMTIDMKGKVGHNSITATVYSNTPEKTYIVRVIANVLATKK